LGVSAATLWWLVVLSGLYHGLNPAMGWPLAVSAGLMGRGNRDLFAALAMLAAGHMIAVLAILLPFGALAALVDWQREIRLVAGGIVIAAGVWLLANRRHPRVLGRIGPKRIALWSFAVAIVHGAGLMLVPLYLGLCSVAASAGDRAAGALMGGNITMAVLVALAHGAAMVAAGGALAYAVYRWLGVRFISRAWFNLEAVWALSLILVGAVGMATAHA
jgi:hypothetical protein